MSKKVVVLLRKSYPIAVVPREGAESRDKSNDGGYFLVPADKPRDDVLFAGKLQEDKVDENVQKTIYATPVVVGFTLLEMLLVLAIVGGILTMAINYGTRQMAQQRRDKTAIQMQQILSAGLAYYTAYGAWPGASCSFVSTSSSNSSSAWSNLSSLTSTGYLPTSMSLNTFGYSYSIACDSVTGNVFYVVTRTSSKANALASAGELPGGYLSDANGNAATNGTYVTAQVMVPGQNLNNARSVNFAGVYHHGACVPVPNCPGYNLATSSCTGSSCMVPQIMVAPAAMSGVNDSSSTNVYPIASFTAYANGPSGTPNRCGTPPTSAAGCTLGSTGIASPNGYYWRVCLQVITQKGDVSSGNSVWGQYASLMVITRCTPPNEPFGSDFTVYTQ